MSIIHTPSAEVFAHSRKARRSPYKRAFIVGNPRFDTLRFGGLPNLPAAERESRRIGAYYTEPVVIHGPEATPERVRLELATADVVDIASHAIADAYEPMRSALVLAAQGRDSGLLYAGEIARLHLQTDVVVLAGCHTAQTATAANVDNLTLAFLAAGARQVVGAQWEVDDHDAAELFDVFHKLLASGTAAEEALRRAQCGLLNKNPLDSWSGFTLIQ